MKEKCSTPTVSIIPFDVKKLGDITKLSDAELKIKLNEGGYFFTKKFQMKNNFIQRRIADSEVLISVGKNIADFNGYIELNASAAFLCNELKEPRMISELEQALEKEFEISHVQAVEDVLEFLKELQKKEMVMVS